MNIKLKFKRTSYIASALILMLTMVPIVPSSRTYADELPSCASDEATLVSLMASADSFSLCDDITKTSVVISKNLEIDLGGHTLYSKVYISEGNVVSIHDGTIDASVITDNAVLNKGTLTLTNVDVVAMGGQMAVTGSGVTTLVGGSYSNNGSYVLKASGAGYIVVKSGTVNGGLIGDVRVEGGIYTVDPSANVMVGYAAYKNGSNWRVETKLTDGAGGNFKFNVSEIRIKEGQILSLDEISDLIDRPADSTTGLAYYANPSAGVADINYSGRNAKGTGLLGLKEGTVNFTVRPLYDTSLRTDARVIVESGLVGINVDDIAVLQEGTARKAISNVYDGSVAYPEYVTGVTYEVDTTSLVDGLEARISTAGDELVVTTGRNAKIAAGDYTVRVKALKNGVDTNLYKDVNVSVGDVFTGFTIEQATDTTITLAENETLDLTLSDAQTMGDIIGVAITDIAGSSDVVSVSGTSLVGNKNGAGSSSYEITATYTSDNGHTYDVKQVYTVEVTSALRAIGVRNADDNDYSGPRYGNESGETELTMSNGDAAELKITKDSYDAGVRSYEVTSADTTIADVSYNDATGEFIVHGRSVGTTTITATAAPRGLTIPVSKTFTVVVEPVFVSFNIDSPSISLLEGDTIQIGVNNIQEAGVEDAISWSYSDYDSSIVSINTDGVVNGLMAGTTNFKVSGTFTTPMGRIITIERQGTIEVLPLLRSITTAEKYFVELGSEEDLAITVDDARVTPTYTYISDNESVAVVVDGKIQTRGGGKATITISATNNGVTVSTTTDVYVYKYATDAEDKYYTAIGGQAIEFNMSEAYNQDSVSCKISGNDCAGDQNLSVVKDADGNYTITAKAGARANTYHLTFTDKVDERTIATKNIDIHVHEVLISDASDKYLKVGDDSARITVREANGNTGHGSIIYRIYDVATGSESDGVTVSRRSNNYTLRAARAGQYEIRFINVASSGEEVTSKSVMVYAIDFTVNDTEYYITVDDHEPKLVTTLNEYWNETWKEDTTGFKITKDSDTEYYFWPTTAGAGNYTLRFTALVNGEVRDTKSVIVHVYKMVAPTETTYYGRVGSTFNVRVADENRDAYTTAEVIEGSSDGLMLMRNPLNGRLFSNMVVARNAGEYRVRYEDHMANGAVAGTYEAKFVIINVVEETLLVAQGDKIEISDNGDYTVSFAEDETRNVELEIKDGKAVFDSVNVQPGRYNVSIMHDFEDGAREVIKETTVIVYKISADGSDLTGVTADTVKKYLEDLMANGRIEDLIDDNGILSFFRLLNLLGDADTQEIFGDYFEGYGSLTGLRDALNDGDEVITKIEVNEINDTVSDEDKEAILGALDGLDVAHVGYYDVSVLMQVNGVTIGNLHKLSDKAVVALALTEDPETGYLRQYFVVRKHNGEEAELLEEGVDFYIGSDGWIYVLSDRFSTFAVAYTDTVAPETPDTGVNTNIEVGAAQSTIVTSIMIIISIVTLAGAVKFAKKH
ncbi:hypothetical protein IJJ36_03720 [Candidatus Saccharibacteria bacterium]|nr:hypothetical protein [Candidatus Saccharibacteria bacterium]